MVTPYGYDEGPTQVQPSYYETSQSGGQPQRQFLMAMGINKVDPDAECAKLKGGPFEDLITQCETTLRQAQQDAAA